MSAKDCGNHGSCRRRELYRRAFATVISIILLLLFIILIIWLVLRPTKPKFYLQDATISEFNLSTQDNYLTSTLQVTISSRNPNDRIGVYYDELHTFIDYQNQQVTVPTALPTGYQGHNDVTIWSPYIYGVAVPVAPYIAMSLGQDQNAGYLLLYVKVEGRLRWKVGSWTSGHYHIDVSCPAFLGVTGGGWNGGSGGGGGGGGGGSSFKFQHISTCTVNV